VGEEEVTRAVDSGAIGTGTGSVASTVRHFPFAATVPGLQLHALCPPSTWQLALGMQAVGEPQSVQPSTIVHTATAPISQRVLARTQRLVHESLASASTAASIPVSTVMSLAASAVPPSACAATPSASSDRAPHEMSAALAHAETSRG
jgi:hypothetical protein